MPHGRKDETVRVSGGNKLIVEDPNYNLPRSLRDAVEEMGARVARGETTFPADLLQDVAMETGQVDDRVAVSARKEADKAAASQVEAREKAAGDVAANAEKDAAAKGGAGTVKESLMAAPAQSADEAASPEQASGHLKESKES
jgi:hypothetical protein